MKCQCGYQYVTEYQPDNPIDKFPAIEGDEPFLVIEPIQSVCGSEVKGKLVACPKCGLVYFWGRI